jgi:hypothetical protein
MILKPETPLSNTPNPTEPSDLRKCTLSLEPGGISLLITD